MCELTLREKELLSDIKEKLADDSEMNKVVVADFVINELRHLIGFDIVDFVIGHQCASSQFNNHFTVGEVPLLSRAGDILSDGYGELASSITTIMSNAEEEGSLHINVHSGVAKALAGSIGALMTARKSNWIDAYNENVKNGNIKVSEGVNDGNTNS